MKIRNNFRRIFQFAMHRYKEVLTHAFWMTVIRVMRERFNNFNRISHVEYLANLQQLEIRPWNLHVELTNVCNAKCIFCAYQYQTRPHEVISDTTFIKALNDYCSIGGGDLMLTSCVGDPLLDSRIVDKIKEARSRPEIKRIATVTNGINLGKIGIEQILNSGISDISISTGPWDRKLYELIYRNKNYHKMRRNVMLLLRKNMESKEPVQIKILFRSNLSMRQTLQLPDYQAISHLPHKVEFNTDYDTWLGEIKQEDLLDGMHIRPRSKLETEPCYWLFDGPIIFVDGSMGLCGCRDFNAQSELIIGNILQSHLLDMWQSESTKRLRSRFTAGEFPDICKKCTTYANLDLYRSKRGSLRAQLIRDWYGSSNKQRGL